MLKTVKTKFNSTRRIVLCALLCVMTVGIQGIAAEGEMTNPFVFIGGYDTVVTTFKLDMNSGALEQLSKSDGGKNPSYMAWHPNRKFIYAINEMGGGRAVAFSINPKDGSLTRINDVSAAGGGPCHITVHPSGKFAVTANYGSGHFGVLPIKTDGSLGEPIEPILAGKNAHQAMTDSTGKFLFIPCLGSDYVAQYLFDAETGAVKPNTPPNAPNEKNAGPRHLAFHPNGKFAYVINERDCTMNSFKYDAATGVLSDPQALPTQPPGTDMKGKSTAHVVVSPNGKFVYGSNRGHDTIVIYSVNAETGRLTLVGHENGGEEVKVPRDFTIDPTGKFLIAASQKTNVVIVFRIDAEKGTLTKLSTTPVSKGPCFVGVMPPPAP